MMDATTDKVAACAQCGYRFYIQKEPAPEWQRGAVRLIKKLITAELKAFRWLNGMPVSPYLCGRCYYEYVCPRVLQEAQS